MHGHDTLGHSKRGCSKQGARVLKKEYSRVLNGAEEVLRVRAAVVAAQHSAVVPTRSMACVVWQYIGYSRGTLRRTLSTGLAHQSVGRALPRGFECGRATACVGLCGVGTSSCGTFQCLRGTHRVLTGILTGYSQGRPGSSGKFVAANMGRGGLCSAVRGTPEWLVSCGAIGYSRGTTRVTHVVHRLFRLAQAVGPWTQQAILHNGAKYTRVLAGTRRVLTGGYSQGTHRGDSRVLTGYSRTAYQTVKC